MKEPQADVADLYVYEAGQRRCPAFALNLGRVTFARCSTMSTRLSNGLERIKEFPLSLRFIRELHG
ncbi:MAG: hypothetical protein R2867_07730 [Caldilineaceae bacterium]